MKRARRALLFPALATLAIGLAEPPGGPATALALGTLAALLPLWSSPLLLLVGAQDPTLLAGGGIGPASAVDTALAIVGLRALLSGGATDLLAHRSAAVAFAVMLAAGAVATAIGAGDDAVTAYMRVATYLGVAALLAGTLDETAGVQFLRGLVGVCAAQAVLALGGVTPATPSDLPLGRFLGTQGDPGQFGIAMAAGFIVIVTSRAVVSSEKARVGLAILIAVGLVGSNTRVVWATAIVALGAVSALQMARSGLGFRARFASGAAFGVILGAGVAVATLGASSVGLNPVSTRVRIDSVSAAWEYFAAQPFSPTGLGNLPGAFPAYNTWLGLAVALTPIFAALLATAAVGLTLAAARLRDLAWAGAGVVFLAATFTENMVFAGSALTLTWFLLLALLRASEKGLAHPPPS